MRQFELPEPLDDGLTIPEVGAWSRDKHHFHKRYLHAFTVAMRKKRWDSLQYVDLFAGAGIEQVKLEDKAPELDWGSPMIAAHLPEQFDQLHLVEDDMKKVTALRTRLASHRQKFSAQIFKGDANHYVKDVVAAIPAGALSVAFLDPYGLHLHFSTLKALASRRMDLIIFFPDHTDALRNWETLYEQDSDSNLDKVLGTGSWRNEKKSTTPENWPDMLTRLYEKQIRTLGYSHFDYERICRTDGRALYKLIFCSKDEAGGKIWKNIAQKKHCGQRTLGF